MSEFINGPFGASDHEIWHQFTEIVTAAGLTGEPEAEERKEMVPVAEVFHALDSIFRIWAPDQQEILLSNLANNARGFIRRMTPEHGGEEGFYVDLPIHEPDHTRPPDQWFVACQRAGFCWPRDVYRVETFDSISAHRIRTTYNKVPVVGGNFYDYVTQTFELYREGEKVSLN